MWLGKTIRLAVLALFTLAAFSLQALSANNPPLPPAAMADKVVVLKSYRKLLLMRGDEVLKTYIVSLGGNPVGPKVRQGDNKTPEAAMSLTGITRTASIIGRFTSLIQTRTIWH